jgi:NADH-quinone oxidoreductase subunit C
LIIDPADLDALTPDQTRTVEHVKARFPEAYRDARSYRGQLSIWVDPAAILDVLRDLKTAPDHLYDMLSDLTALDYLPHLTPGEPRFEVLYIVYSLTFNRRLMVRCRLADGATIPSATAVWSGANFMEREVYDLMGIVFSGHPNLERILTADGWIGHPLRKDFPTMSDQFPNVEQ